MSDEGGVSIILTTILISIYRIYRMHSCRPCCALLQKHPSTTEHPPIGADHSFQVYPVGELPFVVVYYPVELAKKVRDLVLMMMIMIMLLMMMMVLMMVMMMVLMMMMDMMMIVMMMMMMIHLSIHSSHPPMHSSIHLFIHPSLVYHISSRLFTYNLS